MVGASYATTASYNNTLAAFGANQTFATGTKSSGNKTVYHHVQSAPGMLRFWVDAKNGTSWSKVTGNHDRGNNGSGHFSYTNMPKLNSAMRLRGRDFKLAYASRTVKGYVDFN